MFAFSLQQFSLFPSPFLLYPFSLSTLPLLPPPRGKCTVSLLNELEDVHSYLEKEDTFFYTMVYDPNQKTLLVDKGEIRIGPDYQAEIPPYILPG